MNSKIAVLIPCLNEEKTIGKVIKDFQQALPQATIFVYDNGSIDQSYTIAQQAGAVVHKEFRKGKGSVVRRMFEEINADIYIMVDGDDTYFASDVHILMDPVVNGEADMVVGNRLMQASKEDLHWLHHIGNRFLMFILNFLFRANFKDILSGYRVMNRDFVKNIPVLAEEFEIEAEMTIQSLERHFRVIEKPIRYQSRPDGSESKIRAFRDGYKILFTIFWILRDYRPMTFFPLIASAFLLPGLTGSILVLTEYLKTHAVSRMPTAVISIGLIIIGILIFLTGFTISTINRRFNELDDIRKKNRDTK